MYFDYITVYLQVTQAYVSNTGRPKTRLKMRKYVGTFERIVIFMRRH